MEETRVECTGPLFYGITETAVEIGVHEAKHKVAEEAVNMIHHRLGEVLQHPTGYYESRIVTNRGIVEDRVTDSGVVYGPWLEGVSSRNSATRFKGYATFRKVSQALEIKAEVIAEVAITEALRGAS